MPNLITSLAWVPRGKAAGTPTKYALTEEELARISKLAAVELDEAKMRLQAAEAMDAEVDEGEEAEWNTDEENSGEDVDMEDAAEAKANAQAAATRLKAGATQADPNDLSIYNLDDYDKEESKGSAMGAFSNIKGLQFHANQEEDPYITLKESDLNDGDDREELEIFPTDNLLVTARTEDEVSQLDIYVYDENQENLYVHHDLLLPAMPLCLEWLDYTPASSSSMEASTSGKPGNFIAVGTLDPEIEIWNLDVLDGLYPDAILGAPKTNVPTSLESLTSKVEDTTISEPTKSKKKKKKSKLPPPPEASSSYHTDAVLCMSWNKSHRSLLASASADSTIKLWDLSLPSGSAALRSYSVHSDKVQALSWSPSHPTVLLSGSWDGTVQVFDSRSPAGAVGVSVGAEVECVKWNSWKETEFLCALENGHVQSYDSRMMDKKGAKPLWTLAAHDKSCSALDYSDLVNGFLVTGGQDKTVKLWNTLEGGKEGGETKISLVASRDMGVGNVFSARFSPDDPTTIAAAGSNGTLQLWDCAQNAGVRRVFGDRIRALGKDVEAAAQKARDRGGLIGIDKDSESEGEAEE